MTFFLKLAREVTGMGPRTTGNRYLDICSPDGELHGLEICYPLHVEAHIVKPKGFDVP